MKNKSLILLAISLGLTLTAVWLLALTGFGIPEARAASFTVCSSGCDYSVIQNAVDAAANGDVIKIAAGTYADVNNLGGLAQVVYLVKSVTIQGGYTTAFTEPPDPVANPTTLDAGGMGRVIYIEGDINPTIEGLRITGGDTRIIGSVEWGGGVQIAGAAATLSQNVIFNNTAVRGGGVVVYQSDNVIFEGNTISDNIASDEGGGIALYESDNIMLVGNKISNNQANGYGGGGLVFSLCDNVTFNHNRVTGNSTSGDGGGMMPGAGNFTIIGNSFVSNTASGTGGGMAIHNAVGEKIISGNIFAENSAGGEGGGLHLNGTPILTNNMIVDNQTALGGSGINISAGSPKLFHNTIARNTGGGSIGINVALDISVTLTNTIIVSQTVGIFVENNSSATLEATLWGTSTWANTMDWAGAGTIITGTTNIWGDPNFVDYLAGDYHIGENSDAIDAGIDAGVTTDIDGFLRPYQTPDIGADEYWPPGALKFIYLPLVLK